MDVWLYAISNIPLRVPAYRTVAVQRVSGIPAMKRFSTPVVGMEIGLVKRAGSLFEDLR